MSDSTKAVNSTDSASLAVQPHSPTAAPPPGSSKAPGVFARLLRSLPTLAILAALGTLAYWGHHEGWTIPRLSSLRGNAGAADDWCEEHGVPESQCVECQPDLLPRNKEYGWCKPHGVPDCPLEHPDIAQVAEPPEVTAADLQRAQRALDFAERPENNNKCKLHQRRIQFVSREAVEKAGIDIVPVSEEPITESVSANGEVGYDRTRVASLSARVPGTVYSVFKRVGDSVMRGEVLALVDAAEVGKAKSELLTALVQVRLRAQAMERMDEVYQHGAIPEVSYRNQAAAVSEAKIRLTTAQEAMTNLGLPVDVDTLKTVPQEKLADRLRFLGLPESVGASLDPKKTTGNLLALTAPFDGVVVARQVVGGEVVDNNKALFVVVDVRHMWLTLDLRQEDTNKLALGQAVRFRPDGSSTEVQGTISWISTSADPKTRTVKVRSDLPNTDGRLRANTFGQGQIILREEKNAVVVPNEAVHWEGCCHVVFVRDRNYLKENAPKVFHVRTVRIGARDSKKTEIISGLLVGEVVASKGSGTLRAELLKNNLGEG